MTAPYAVQVLTIVALVLALLVLPSPWGVVAVAVAAVIDLVEAGVFLWWSKRPRHAVGVETLVGRQAVVVRASGRGGQVKIDGELWEARASTSVPVVGARVVVRGVEGLVLLVEPVDELEVGVT